MNALKLALVGTAASFFLVSCATQQSNPFYKQTPEYAQARTVQTIQSTPQTVPVTYRESTSPVYSSQSYPASSTSTVYAQPVTTAQAQAACQAREQNYKTFGAMIGGAAGAYAGKKLADDNETLGMVGGAAVGGSLGYGAGDMLVDCDPVHVPVSQRQVYAAPQPIAASQPAAAPVYVAPAQTSQAVMVETGGQNAAEYGYNNSGYVTEASNLAPTPAIEQRVSTYVPAAQPAIPTGMTYIVQEGDTAWNLSRKTCSTIGQIKTLNNLEGDFLIKAGEAILLPASTC